MADSHMTKDIKHKFVSSMMPQSGQFAESIFLMFQFKIEITLKIVDNCQNSKYKTGLRKS